MNRELLQSAADTYGTPSYVFDLDMLKERLTMMKHILGPKVTLCYAMKANPFLVAAMEGLTQRFEVCSPGEFAICEKQGIPMEHIVLSGVNKETNEINRVIETYRGKGIFTIESLEQLRILAQAAAGNKKQLQVLLRLTSGNQFGMDKSTICGIIKNREQYPYLTILGLQLYSGTQKKKLARIEAELRELDAFCKHLQQEYQFEVNELEYGPGFYVSYFQNEADYDYEKLLKEFSEILKNMDFKGHITLEMGRYMVAYCGYFLTTIIDCKHNQEQNYCIVDGGIHHMNYYGQMLAMKLPHFLQMGKSDLTEPENWNICGSLCTVGDVLVRQLPLNAAKPGDILVFERLGAYSVTEGISLFLSRDLPKILFYSEQDGLQLVRNTLNTHTINSMT